MSNEEYQRWRQEPGIATLNIDPKLHMSTYLQTFHDLSEDDVEAIKLGSWSDSDSKLRSTRELTTSQVPFPSRR